ncbi:hypothetical protein [Isoptericola aurantiacus]|uniref:hypothetical protein n=1 Tax=Isoptericola aurantiacus TaxID=3377839 RepID=UPI00383BA3F9
MPITSRFFHTEPWQLDDDTVEVLAGRLRVEFDLQMSGWADVVRAVVRLVDDHISREALLDARDIARSLGDDDTADWLRTLVEDPELIDLRFEEQAEKRAHLASLGAFVRRRDTFRGGVDAGPGPWHEAGCPFVARAVDVYRWEGTDDRPEVGSTCPTCRPRRELHPSGLPPAEADRVRDAIRDEIAGLGSFVRRQGEDGYPPIPPGKWHKAGCRTTRTAADPRSWEGSDDLPAGEDTCKTCLKRPSTSMP